MTSSMNAHARSLRPRPRTVRLGLALIGGLVAAVAPMAHVPVVSAANPGTLVGLSPWLSPDGSLSTSGDFATDTFSDPWDFSNGEDIDVTPGTGVTANDVSMTGGQLHLTTVPDTNVRLLFKWAGYAQPVNNVLPWGRDGWLHPIDAGRYSRVSFSINSSVPSGIAIRFFTASGQQGFIPVALNAGWQQITVDLNDRSKYIAPSAQAVWGGPITTFELHTPQVGVRLDLDWVRLHRADASPAPNGALPVSSVITPSEEGGADYASAVRGNPWDFAGPDDVAETFQVANIGYNGQDLTGNTVGNDPFISLAMGPPLNTDKYHRFTVDVCYSGGFSLEDGPGGGMIGRLIWMPEGSTIWTETQDFIVYPGLGCNNITIDLNTAPADALHDEYSSTVTGWRGVNISRLRFDLDEDRGVRAFTLKNLKLADDAAFSTSYPIAFRNAAGTPGTTADVYVTTNRAQYDGTLVARGIPMTSGEDKIVNWNGTTAAGAPMPNGTYWVYVVMRNSAGVAVGYSTGPVRLEKPVPSAPSYYVPLTPARLLDTRTGEGGNLSPLSTDWFTELDVTGVGGVPETNVTAVVMNVTAADPTSGGYLTVWPSGEPRPTVSSLNFVPGQIVPNLVTVKVGANGRVNIYNQLGSTHVIADVAGYYTTVPPGNGGKFTALTPSRILDSREGVGAPPAALAQGQSIDLTVTGVGGVPSSGVEAVALNVTVDAPTAPGFLTVWPTGVARPNASTHNFVPGLTVANMVIAKVGANGKVSIFNSAGETQVVADVIGYFSSNGGLFVPVTPKRLEDTRETAAMGTSGTRTMLMADSAPVPPGAKAVIVNVTSVNSTAGSYVTVWPTSSTMPLASTLNPRPGVAVPNQAYLRVGANGSIDAFNAYGQTDLIVDVFGYVM